MFDEYSEKFKALGHPVRLQIVAGLSKKECNVTKMCEGLNLHQATVSRHLSILKAAGIVEGVRNGSEICYHLVDKKVEQIINILGEGKNV
ncbi:metalloregulator ArsR/SmtB family transcription factor [Deferribacterales bacterium Es71-Z0220]|uniref:ArsR/SmtB family transcription factor n=1 Tax=Deferrivibrio essentukiensis TaxID=2880922 RepID=UPI001F60A7E2|nr:metalloregulator ArsR/SmtB family transcription factor [Deferrivibrio essentukiensis]MCB4205526.1 metalloregulator ArsR/SmtB family transcription factor [Deferrivibrio essentukiensis]